MNHQYLNALSLIPSLGPAKLKRLLDYFKIEENIWHASFSELQKAKIDNQTIEEIIHKRKEINPEKEWGILATENIKVLSILDEEYPKILKNIHTPPPILYLKGQIKPDFNYGIAIVGSRKATNYGQEATYRLAYELAQNGLTIISGFALGIDSISHQAALEARASTIAILGSSLLNNELYPQLNKKFVQPILEHNGALISEFAPGTLTLKQNFPRRNRIISGISIGVLIIEASETSGSLITARYGLEQGKDIFAVPGSIFSSNSCGTNNLIKMGAKLVTNAQDILDELHLEKIKEKIEVRKILPATCEEAKILEILSSEPTHIDIITKEGGLNASLTNSTLIMMEMKGKVKHMGGNMYIVCS